MKPVRFHAAARFEAREATRYYESKQPGLGTRFVNALENALQRIGTDPQLYRSFWGDVRKCRVLRFPFGVLFRERGDCIYVIAVMHLHRDPDYWKPRAEPRD